MKTNVDKIFEENRIAEKEYVSLLERLERYYQIDDRNSITLKYRSDRLSINTHGDYNTMPKETAIQMAKDILDMYGVVEE